MTNAEIDILKMATEWAKTEIFSSAFFGLFGILFVMASICFWHYGKTDTARAYIIPFLVVGGLLIILGVGLIISNYIRMSHFPSAYEADAAAFMAAEIKRAHKTINGYNNAVFTIIPLVIIIGVALLMVMKAPVWHASIISAIAMMAVILVIDTNASARLEHYKHIVIKVQNAH